MNGKRNNERRNFSKAQLEAMSIEGLKEQRLWFSARINQVNNQLAVYREEGEPEDRKDWRKSAVRAKRALEHQYANVKAELVRRKSSALGAPESVPYPKPNGLLFALLANEIGLDAHGLSAESLDERVEDCIEATARIEQSLCRVLAEEDEYE